jgi:hypothetical protein
MARAAHRYSKALEAIQCLVCSREHLGDWRALEAIRCLVCSREHFGDWRALEAIGCLECSREQWAVWSALEVFWCLECCQHLKGISVPGVLTRHFGNWSALESISVSGVLLASRRLFGDCSALEVIQCLECC